MFAYLRPSDKWDERIDEKRDRVQYEEAKPVKSTPRKRPLPAAQVPSPAQEKKKKTVVSSTMALLDCSKDLQAVSAVLEALSKLAILENSGMKETLETLKLIVTTVSHTVSQHAGHVSPVHGLTYAHSRLKTTQKTSHQKSLNDVKRQVEKTVEKKRQLEKVHRRQQQLVRKRGTFGSAPSAVSNRSRTKDARELVVETEAILRWSQNSAKGNYDRITGNSTAVAPTARSLPADDTLLPRTSAKTAVRELSEIRPKTAGTNSPASSVTQAASRETTFQPHSASDSAPPDHPTAPQTTENGTEKTAEQNKSPPSVPTARILEAASGVVLLAASGRRTLEASLTGTNVTTATTTRKLTSPTTLKKDSGLVRTANDGNPTLPSKLTVSPFGETTGGATFKTSISELGGNEVTKPQPAKPSAKSVQMQANFGFTPPANGFEYTPKEFHKIGWTSGYSRKIFMEFAMERRWIPCQRTNAYRILKLEESELPTKWGIVGRPTHASTHLTKVTDSIGDDACQPLEPKKKSRKVLPKMEIPAELPKPKDGKEYTPAEFYTMVQPYVSNRCINRGIEAAREQKYIPISRAAAYKIASSDSVEEVPLRWNKRGRPPIVSVGELQKQLRRHEMTKEELHDWLVKKKREQSQENGSSGTASASVSQRCASRYHTLLSVMDLDLNKGPKKESRNQKKHAAADESTGGSD